MSERESDMGQAFESILFYFVSLKSRFGFRQARYFGLDHVLICWMKRLFVNFLKIDIFLIFDRLMFENRKNTS